MKDDQGRHRIVADLVPTGPLSQACFPSGRLDRDTTGLLLFSTDGETGARASAPARARGEVATWRCVGGHARRKRQLGRLARGRHAGRRPHAAGRGAGCCAARQTQRALDDAGDASPARQEGVRREYAARVVGAGAADRAVVQVGHPRRPQATRCRRMLGAVGHPVVALHRESFGPLDLGGLAARGNGALLAADEAARLGRGRREGLMLEWFPQGRREGGRAAKKRAVRPVSSRGTYDKRRGIGFANGASAVGRTRARDAIQSESRSWGSAWWGPPSPPPCTEDGTRTLRLSAVDIDEPTRARRARARLGRSGGRGSRTTRPSSDFVRERRATWWCSLRPWPRPRTTSRIAGRLGLSTASSPTPPPRRPACRAAGCRASLPHPRELRAGPPHGRLRGERHRGRPRRPVRGRALDPLSRTRRHAGRASSPRLHELVHGAGARG